MAKKTKLSVGAKKGKTLKLDVGEFSDKTKEIEVVDGVTTVAEALNKAGHSVPGDRTAKEEGWRLNGHVCNWTDKITGKSPTLYRLPKGKAGQE